MTDTNSSDATQDEVYCHHLARRAVARAALHLSIPTMSEEALDTMADCLLAYLARIGSTLSHLVEASNRSTSHCSALDMLHAVELNSNPTNANNNNNNNTNHSWKDLAHFCFGDTWQSDVATPIGYTQGWNAPFPEEIPDFPNPLPSIQLYQEMSDSNDSDKNTDGTTHAKLPDDTKELMDDALAKSDVPWGSLLEQQPLQTTNAQHKDETEPTDEKITKKRSRSNTMDYYWPADYPPLPVRNLKKIRESLTTTTNSTTKTQQPLSNSTVRTALIVPPGRHTDTLTQQIVPVARASGSRVSRILEGSLEPAS